MASSQWLWSQCPPVTEPKLAPLAAGPASHSRGEALGQEGWLYSEASRRRRWWTGVLKSHLDSGWASGFRRRSHGNWGGGPQTKGQRRAQTSRSHLASREARASLLPWLLRSGPRPLQNLRLLAVTSVLRLLSLLVCKVSGLKANLSASRSHN